MDNNGTSEVLEAISTLSSHVDTQIKEMKGHVDTQIKEVKGHVDTQIKEVKAEIGKLRSDLIDHVSRTVANATLTTRDPRIPKVVLKLRDKNIFDVQDVQDILAQPVAG